VPRIHRTVSVLSRVRALHPELAEPEAAIRRGRVLVEGVPALNPRRLVPADQPLVVLPDPVPRGTRKLGPTLDRLRIDVRGAVALDAGAAAGGFTSALLEAGAARVYAVDVGYGQLVGSLRQDGRVVVLERTNVADLTTEVVTKPLDLITLDLSYVSVARAVPQLHRVTLRSDAHLVALVKPMFELGVGTLPPPDRWQDAIDHAVAGVAGAGWRVEEVVRSPILGARGAVEFFLYARRP
jgi:23S rRNA (cytidine1920-2'-O)/16S rRNA (cytidine1409-2'-O)-methyltransferase